MQLKCGEAVCKKMAKPPSQAESTCGLAADRDPPQADGPNQASPTGEGTVGTTSV